MMEPYRLPDDVRPLLREHAGIAWNSLIVVFWLSALLVAQALITLPRWLNRQGERLEAWCGTWGRGR